MELDQTTSLPGFSTTAPSQSPAGGTACLLCNSARRDVVFREFDVDIVRCSDCGHVFSSAPTDSNYDGYWGDEVVQPDAYWSAARESMYVDFRNRFITGRSGRLLDMGCGLGFFVRGIAANPSWQAHGCEISPA